MTSNQKHLLGGRAAVAGAIALGLVTGLLASPAAEPDRVVTVVADGVGTTADEAVKDALRNAVRQVVGVLIDAETQVKNDEVISDKVLALSNGFVAKYERLSEKRDGGLVRVRVSAVVERGQVAAKLREFKVTTTAVDGNALAVEKMTKEEVQKNTTALLKKVLAELPKTLKAELVGAPKEAKGGYAFKVRVEPDTTALAAVGKDLEALLSKACSRKDGVLFTGQGKYHSIKSGTANLYRLDLNAVFRTPVDESSEKDLAVFMLSWVGERRDAARLGGYLVRAGANDVYGVLDGSVTVRVELLNDAGKAITEGEVVPQRFKHGDIPIEGENWLAHFHEAGSAGSLPSLLFLAPAFGQLVSGGGYSYSGGSAVENTLIIPATEAELKRLKQVRCAVQFKPKK